MTEEDVKVLQVQLRMAGKVWEDCHHLSQWRGCKGEVKCYYEKENYWGHETYHFLCRQHDHLSQNLMEVVAIQCD